MRAPAALASLLAVDLAEDGALRQFEFGLGQGLRLAKVGGPLLRVGPILGDLLFGLVAQVLELGLASRAASIWGVASKSGDQIALLDE